MYLVHWSAPADGNGNCDKNHDEKKVEQYHHLLQDRLPPPLVDGEFMCSIIYLVCLTML